MRAFRKRPGERGFTLIEMVITALISGIMMIVVSRMFLGSYSGWLFNYSTMIAQQKSRIFRDNLIKTGRQAQASTVQIDRYNGNVPYRSMLSFTDIQGKNWAFLQFKDKVHITTWSLDDDGNRRAGKKVGTAWELNDAVVQSKVERLQFYYPNLKDLRKLSFALTLEWALLADNKMKPVTIHMVGDIEIRDP